MNPIARMMKRYIKMPLKYALPLLFIGALVLASTTGCSSPVSITPGHATVSTAPTGPGTNYDVSIFARAVPVPTDEFGGNLTKPQSGYEYAAVQCSLKDNNVANLFTVWREWTAKDANGTLYNNDVSVVDIANAYPKTTIQPGNTARGIITYQVPIGTKIVQMRYLDETTNTHMLTCNVTT
jgi:hypothetical protein